MPTSRHPALRCRRLAVAAACATAALGVAESSAQTLPSVPVPSAPSVVPKVTAVPTVQAPKVQVPKVETPKVEVPKVEVPKVETPKVETPKVQVPKVEAPKTETPKVQVPKTDLPTAPSGGKAPVSPKTPALPTSPSTGAAPAVPGTSDLPAAAPESAGLPDDVAGGVVRRGGRSGNGSGAGGSETGGGNSSPAAALGALLGRGPGSGAGGGPAALGSAGADSGRRRAAAVDAAVDRSDHFKRSRSQKRLQRALEEHGGCLGRLSSTQRRLVLLRVGVNGKRPLSRRRVARRLDMSLKRLVREERRAIRRLTGGGSCSAASDQAGAADGGAAIDAGSAARGLGALLAGDPALALSVTTSAQGEVAGARASGSDAGPAEGVAAERHDATERTVNTPFGAFDSTSRGSIAVAMAFAALAALAALLLAREFRRQWRIW